MNEGQQSYSRISEDDIERTKLVALLLLKKETLGTSRLVNVNEWKNIGDVFEKMKFMLDDMEMDRIISPLTYAIGGTAMFTIVEKQGYVDFLYKQITDIVDKVKR